MKQRLCRECSKEIPANKVGYRADNIVWGKGCEVYLYCNYLCFFANDSRRRKKRAPHYGEVKV